MLHRHCVYPQKVSIANDELSDTPRHLFYRWVLVQA